MTERINVVLGLQAGSFATEGKKVEKALGAIGDKGEASARQIAAATRGLPAQFTDIATQLAGGQNPFLVLLQQGGQIKDQFGGIGAALRGIAGAVNPLTLLAGAAAAVGGAALIGANESRKFADTLQLTGNAAGLTIARFEDLSAKVVDSSRQTIGASRDIVQALAASGQSSGAVLESQAKAVARIADLSGKAAKDVAASFASQLDAPAKFAAEMNRSMNFLAVATFKRIQQLEREGKATEAATLTNEKLLKALDKQRQNLSYLESAWDSAGKMASRTWDFFVGLGREESTIKKLQDLSKELREREDRGPLNERTKQSFEKGNQRLRERILLLAEQAAQEVAAADAASVAAEANQRKIASALRGDEPKPLGAIRSGRDQTRADFLRSEKAAYADLAALERAAARQSEEDRERSLDELMRMQGEEEEVRRQALEKRIASEQTLLQQLSDENARAGIALIEDERQRGLALIALDREIAVRRAKASDLGDDALGRAIGLIDRSAALSGQKLDADLDRAAARAGDAMAESISDGILNGFREGSSLVDIFTRELKAQFARTVLTPLIRPTVDAGNEMIGQLIRGAIGAFSGTLSVDPNGIGLSPGAADFATGATIHGRRAGGGRVSPHSTYLVGERGPELLRMGGDGGRVLPTPAAGGVNVSMPVSVHIDARSDQAQVAQLVTSAVADAQRRMYEDLRARRVIG